MSQNAHTEERFKDVSNSSSFRGAGHGCHWAVEGDMSTSGTYQTSVVWGEMLDPSNRIQCHLFSLKGLVAGGLNRNRRLCMTAQIPTEPSSCGFLPTEAHVNSKSRGGHIVCGHCLAPSQAFLLCVTKSALFWQTALGVGREMRVSTAGHLWYLWSLPCPFSLILLFRVVRPTAVPTDCLFQVCLHY